MRGKMMNNVFKILLSLMLVLMMAVPALAAEYDLVIENGRVMDPESNNEVIN